MVLAELGKSRLASKVNQLAKAANMSTLDVTPEVEQQLETACREIQTMRTLLIAALGVMPEQANDTCGQSASRSQRPGAAPALE